MRQVLIIILLFSSVFSFGQKKNRWQLTFQLQPELTFHKNQYSYRWKERFTKQTFNVGIASFIQYNLTDNIFVEGGVAFISRKLVTKAFVDQSLLPPPYYDSTKPLYVTKSIALRTLQFPLTIGVIIAKTRKTNFFVEGTYIPNFLVNVKYEVQNYPSFRKNYWQGHSLNAGGGMEYQLNKKIILTSSVSYSLTNTVRNDPYLFSQDERPISLPHKYLQLNTGIKLQLNRH